MEDNRIMVEAFEHYYDKGIDALKRKDHETARRYFLSAAESLLKLAKNSNGAVKAQRLKRANELYELADKIEKQEKQKTSTAIGTEFVEKTATDSFEKLTLEESLAKLNSLIGLRSVKQQVLDWIDQIKVFKMRSERGMAVPPMSYHLVFTGNPGTGKTTVARLISHIYRELGVLSKGHLVEVDRGDLVVGYIGQTAPKTKELIEKAKGGVLFIDEAYSLSIADEKDFGKEAIDTLLRGMEENRNDLAVIVAGYDKPMEAFIQSNPGLASRFKTKIHFNDYSEKELFEIFTSICEENQYTLAESAKAKVMRYLSALKKSGEAALGNGRAVRNLFENVVTLQAKRLAEMSNPSNEDFETIISADVPGKTTSIERRVPEEPIKRRVLERAKAREIEEKAEENAPEETPEDTVLNGTRNYDEFKFDWDKLPSVKFEDVAGLDSVKETVRTKVLLPLENPEAFEGYVKKNGGGLLMYGPPGTGKTMLAAAIANEIGAKFCSVKPSDLLHQGVGQSEKAIRALFAQARQLKCAVICFDELDAISPKNTKSQYAKQLRSEFLAQLQGIESYGKDNDHILYLVATTNKPWDIDSAFLRPGRFGTRVYVGLPDADAREYMIRNRLQKIEEKGVVHLAEDIDIPALVEETNGLNGSDMTELLDKIEELSILRNIETGDKTICAEDFEKALDEIGSSVQPEDIEKLKEWKKQNG